MHKTETQRIHEARMDGLLDSGYGFELKQLVEADLRERCPSLSGHYFSELRDTLTVRALASVGML